MVIHSSCGLVLLSDDIASGCVSWSGFLMKFESLLVLEKKCSEVKNGEEKVKSVKKIRKHEEDKQAGNIDEGRLISIFHVL